MPQRKSLRESIMNDASSDEDTGDDDEEEGKVFSPSELRKKRAVAETTRAEAPFDARICTKDGVPIRRER